MCRSSSSKIVVGNGCLNSKLMFSALCLVFSWKVTYYIYQEAECLLRWSHINAERRMPEDWTDCWILRKCNAECWRLKVIERWRLNKKAPYLTALKVVFRVDHRKADYKAIKKVGHGCSTHLDHLYYYMWPAIWKGTIWDFSSILRF